MEHDDKNMEEGVPVLVALPNESDDETITFANIEKLGHPQVGLYIRVLRRQRGWTQGKLAMEAGVTQPEISTAERSPQDCSLNTFLEIASAFGVSIHDLTQEPVIRIKNGRDRQLRPRHVL